MSECSLSQGTIYLRGEVSFATVTNLHRQLQTLMHTGAHTMDCSGVTKVDSSITALILVALRLAKDAGTDLRIIKLPEAVSRLMKLYDLEAIFLSTPSLPLPLSTSLTI
jgi:phospholipid transport system transporter-binding protein